MLNFSRAGSLALFTLFIHSFILLFTFAAPVAVAPPTSISITAPNSYALNNPFPQVLSGSLSKRDSFRSSSHVFRSIEESEIEILVRRKSIGAKIRDAFKKVGNGIKKGFQKVGQGIKHVAKKIGNGIKTAAKKVGNGIKHVAKKIGNGIKTAAKKVGNGIKHVAKKVGNGIKHVAKKIGHGIKTAAKKVGHFVKTTGAKIAKFGLKVLSTAQSVAAKVAGFIPGIGKPIGKALKAASMGTNALSNRIHVSLGSKLDKGMRVMDKIRNPVSGAGGAVLDAILRREEGDEWVIHRELDDSLWDREFDDDDLYARDYDLEERDDVDFEDFVE
jgi:gas vesicle protein